MNYSEQQIRAIRDNSKDVEVRDLAQDCLRLLVLVKKYIKTHGEYSYYSDILYKSSGVGGNTPESNQIYHEYKTVCKTLQMQVKDYREEIAKYVGVEDDLN
jgi:hypothetical protein